MRKTGSASFPILCLLLTLLLVGYGAPAEAIENRIYVPTNYLTIQEAINHANPGDTIFVYNKTYLENVVVNKSISLVGEDRKTTIIDGGEKGSVVLVTANNVKISGFTIRNSGTAIYDSGILVDHSRGNDISHNTIANSFHGIYLLSSRDNTISNNNVSSNRVNGISIDSSINNQVSGNNALSNGINGIRLSFSSGNTISGGNISSNKVNGIRFDSSNYNAISDNNISSNNINGILLDFSKSNVISGNNLYSENGHGISIDSSSDNNTIYHNNLNNKYQVQSDSTNIWDLDHEGNYWIDYTGQDQGEDGIGDTPYFINMENQDNYPLGGNFFDFDATWRDKIYRATTISNSTISNFRFEVGRETGNKIMSFDIAKRNGAAGFCRVMIPTELMNPPYTVLFDEEEITSNPLNISDATNIYLYFTYAQNSHTIEIISSKSSQLYNELVDAYEKLQTEFYNLNSTYYEHLNNYSALQGNYSQLVESYRRLNESYQQYLIEHNKQQENYTSLSFEYTQNIRNLTYAFIATTTIFIVAAAYLSTQAHKRTRSG